MYNPSASSTVRRTERAPVPRPWDHPDPEHRYGQWQRRFMRRLGLRLPDVSHHQLQAAAHTWSHHFDQIEPEEAAEIAAMWWQAPATSARRHAA